MLGGKGKAWANKEGIQQITFLNKSQKPSTKPSLVSSCPWREEYKKPKLASKTDISYGILGIHCWWCWHPSSAFSPLLEKALSACKSHPHKLRTFPRCAPGRDWCAQRTGGLCRTAQSTQSWGKERDVLPPLINLYAYIHK